ncbi:MAG: hypothetical protein ACLU3U_11955 [Gallintestinimicrobium sp.]
MSKIRKSPQKQTAIRAKEAFTESLRLPRDVMLGASILTLIGDTELLVEITGESWNIRRSVFFCRGSIPESGLKGVV